jgi:DNA-directed RNA polymerase subunit RPC12/RpoP
MKKTLVLCPKCGGKMEQTQTECEFCRKDRIIKPRDTHPYQALKDWPYEYQR